MLPAPQRGDNCCGERKPGRGSYCQGPGQSGIQPGPGVQFQEGNAGHAGSHASDACKGHGCSFNCGRSKGAQAHREARYCISGFQNPGPYRTRQGQNEQPACLYRLLGQVQTAMALVQMRSYIWQSIHVASKAGLSRACPPGPDP